MRRAAIAALTLMLACDEIASAGVTSAVLKETYELVVRKFAKEAAEEGLDVVAKNMDSLAAKYGDDALEAFRKVGPKAFRVVDEAGVEGAQAVRLLAKHGDDALWVVAKPSRLALAAKYGDDAAEAMIRHGEVAEPLIEKLGASATKALTSVSAQNGRRLAIMAEEGSLAQIGKSDDLLAVVGKYGDRAMNFIWNNKAALAVTAGLTAFLANPEPFIDGSLDLTKTVADATVRPMAESFARDVDWTIVAVMGTVLAAIGLGWRSYRRQRSAARRGAIA